MNDENNTACPSLMIWSFRTMTEKGAPTGVSAPFLDDIDFRTPPAEAHPQASPPPSLMTWRI